MDLEDDIRRYMQGYYRDNFNSPDSVMSREKSFPDMASRSRAMSGRDSDEAKFQYWLSELSNSQGREAGNDLQDYDMRGAYLSGIPSQQPPGGHFPDTFKKPNHETFSNESIYHNTTGPAGVPWEGGRWSGENFSPSDQQNNPTLQRARDLLLFLQRMNTR